jgi:hypothetical protein
VLGFLGPEDVFKAQLGLDRHVALCELREVLPRLVHGPVVPLVHGPVVPVVGMAKQAEAEPEEGPASRPAGVVQRAPTAERRAPGLRIAQAASSRSGRWRTIGGL